MNGKPAAIYNPQIYDVLSIPEALNIVLTAEGGLSPEERNRRETPYLIDLMLPWVTSRRAVLDYGCGFGRLSLELINRLDCHVVGVDISPNMRGLAQSYVKSDKFLTCSPAGLDLFTSLFDLAISVWTLQHCYDVRDDIARIYKHLRIGGRLFVVNNRKRVVPTIEPDWVDDGIDVRDELLAAGFELQTDGILDPATVSKDVSDYSFWAVYRK